MMLQIQKFQKAVRIGREQLADIILPRHAWIRTQMRKMKGEDTRNYCWKGWKREKAMGLEDLHSERGQEYFDDMGRIGLAELSWLLAVARAARAVVALGIAEIEGEHDYWIEYMEKWGVLEASLDALEIAEKIRRNKEEAAE